MNRSLLLLAMASLFACGDPGAPDSGEFDSGIHDAEPREGGFSDALADDASTDAGNRDVGVTDVPLLDGGEGLLCEQAVAWPVPALPLIDTTTVSFHRGRFECAGVGGGSIAPERWIVTRFDQPTHAILRLGTGGWDAVMSVRTATCAEQGEVACADEPAIVELPAVEGNVFIGVDGFTDGSGPFVLSGEVGPPLTVPPLDSVCELAPPATLPVHATGHNFGADPAAEIEGCPLFAPVFVPIDLPAGELSVRVEPRAGQDLSLAVLSECGATLACSAAGGAGHAEKVARLAPGAGRITIAIGSPPGARAGSFVIAANAGAECVEDADCPLGERCDGNLACGPPAARSAVSVGAEIPDNDKLELPLALSGSDGRPSRVRLRIAIEHEFPRDLVVTLSPPGGWPRVRVRDRLDGALDSVYGSDRPADGPGTMFDFGLAATASGTWTLEVEDRAPGDVGRVTGAVLEVE
jgi:hypothetical protein